MSIWRAETGYLGRYVGSGLLNTAVGFAVIFGMTAAGASPYLANIAGYAVGLVLGFWTARAFVFRSTGAISREGCRYLLAFAISWLLNLLILKWGIDTAGLRPMMAQVAAASGYSLSMFLLGRCHVFSPNGITSEERDLKEMHSRYFSWRWVVFFLCFIMLGKPAVDLANEEARRIYESKTTAEWTNVNVWIRSADCARTTGAWLAICEDGKLYPIANSAYADDPGHALLLGLAAIIKNRSMSVHDVAKLNIVINLFGIFVLSALLFSMRHEVASLLALALGFGSYFLWVGASPHPGLVGVTIMAAIYPLTILLIENGHINGPRRAFLLILGLALLGLAALLRGSIGSMGAAASIVILAYLTWAKFKQRQYFRYLAMLILTIIALQAPNIVHKSRDVFFPMEPANHIQAHGLSHSLYIGLGAAGENKFGIRWDDGDGMAAAKKVNPDVVYVSPEYFRILRSQYFQHVANQPLEVVRVYSLKFLELIKQRHPDWGPPLWLIILGAFILLATGRRHQIWKANGSASAPIFLIVALIFIGLFLAQGVLAHPDRQYSYPIGAFSILIIAIGLELFIRHGLRSNKHIE